MMQRFETLVRRMPADVNTGAQKWDVNQERIFSETLMQTRFNFFLVLFAAWIIAVQSIKEKIPKLVFLGFGIAICILLWLAIWRIAQKVMPAIDIIWKDQTHPSTQVDAAAGRSRIIRVRSNCLIGFYIPCWCIVLLLAWGVYVWVWQ